MLVGKSIQDLAVEVGHTLFALVGLARWDIRPL